MSAIAQSQRRNAPHQCRRPSTGHHDAHPNAGSTPRIMPRSSSSALIVHHQSNQMKHIYTVDHHVPAYPLPSALPAVAVKLP